MALEHELPLDVLLANFGDAWQGLRKHSNVELCGKKLTVEERRELLVDLHTSCKSSPELKKENKKLLVESTDDAKKPHLGRLMWSRYVKRGEHALEEPLFARWGTGDGEQSWKNHHEGHNGQSLYTTCIYGPKTMKKGWRYMRRTVLAKKESSNRWSQLRRHAYIQARWTLGRTTQTFYLHHMLCTLYRGPPPRTRAPGSRRYQRYTASHLCDHGGCIAPWHLAWQTVNDNIKLSWAYGQRVKKERCSAMQSVQRRKRKVRGR